MVKKYVYKNSRQVSNNRRQIAGRWKRCIAQTDDKCFFLLHRVYDLTHDSEEEKKEEREADPHHWLVSSKIFLDAFPSPAALLWLLIKSILLLKISSAHPFAAPPATDIDPVVTPQLYTTTNWRWIRLEGPEEDASLSQLLADLEEEGCADADDATAAQWVS